MSFDTSRASMESPSKAGARGRHRLAVVALTKKIGVSPTYLSKVERDEFPPPAEDKVRKIAGIIEQDADELLALAGRVASDLTEIIREQPREMADFLRAARGLAAEDMARLARHAQKAKDK